MNRLALIISTLALSACSGGGGDITTAANTSSATPTSTTDTVAGLKTVEQVDVVSAQESTATGKSIRRAFGRAFTDAGTDYVTDEQNYHVWHPALEPIESVNGILCFIGQVKASELVNTGPYIALVDDSKCEKGEGNSSAQGNQSSSSEDSLPNYVQVVADATRTSSSAPMEVKIWIPEMEMGDGGEGGGGQSALIKAKVTVKEAPSSGKPLGDFRMAFDFSTEELGSMGGGELASAENGADTGFTFHEAMRMGPMSESSSASLLAKPDGSAGTALTSSERSGGGGGSEGGTFGLAFNEATVLGRKGANPGAIASQADGQGACLSRTEFDEAVWRYNLYNKATGARVTLNSGFPFTYEDTNDENEKKFGYVGYWGVWTEGNDDLNGKTITKQTFGEQGAASNETFTVSTAPGKLIKYTAAKATLAEMDGVRFNYWDETTRSNDNNPNNDYDQWLVELQSGKFMVIAGINWSHDGPPEETAVTPRDITPTDETDVIHLWSEQLGGGVVYRGADTGLVYHTQEVMSSSATDIDLYCYERCTKGDLTAVDLETWDDPFTNPMSMVGSVTPVHYKLKQATMTLVKINGDSSETVVDYPTDATESSAYEWGVRTGHLVDSTTNTAISSNPWDIYNPTIVSVFYEWETGDKDWNKLTLVKNGADAVQSFDKPIHLSYTHSTDNDRSGDDSYDGQRFLLSYQGDGQLHGIPFEAKVKSSDGKKNEDKESEDRHVRWYPVFNLNDGAILSNSGTEYVVKAIDIEQMMSESTDTACNTELAAQFDSMAHTLPTGFSATYATDISSVGDLPTLEGDDAVPKVIGGEVQE